MTETVSSRMLDRNMTTAHADTATTNAQAILAALCGLARGGRCSSRRCSAGGLAFTATASTSPSSTGCTAGRPRSFPPRITGFYLLTAALVVFVSDAIARLGPRRVMLVGACCFGIAVALMAFIDALWQLYLVYLLMAVGAATMHVGAISNVVGLWFDRQRALAISLALNGASSAASWSRRRWCWRLRRYGFSNAMVGAAVVMAVVLLPAIAFGSIGPALAHAGRPAPAAAPGRGEARCAARSSGAWPRRSRWR